MLLAGFVNYFAFGNANGLSSPLWTLRSKGLGFWVWVWGLGLKV